MPPAPIGLSPRDKLKVFKLYSEWRGIATWLALEKTNKEQLLAVDSLS